MNQSGFHGMSAKGFNTSHHGPSRSGKESVISGMMSPLFTLPETNKPPLKINGRKIIQKIAIGVKFPTFRGGYLPIDK